MKNSPNNLYPMQVTPFNFSRGDVVKKIYTDQIQTPYTGIVTAIVPSTNKVQVQWPDSVGIEDPWDLIKVNPLINPPVVNLDKAYPSFQNELSHKYYEKIKPHRILENFMEEHMTPVYVFAAKLYNSGVSKIAAYKEIVSNIDNKLIAERVIHDVYKDQLNMTVFKKFEKDGQIKNCTINLNGNSDVGFNLEISCEGELPKKYEYDNVKDAFEHFEKYKEMKSEPISVIVGNVLKHIKQLKSE